MLNTRSSSIRLNALRNLRLIGIGLVMLFTVSACAQSRKADYFPLTDKAKWEYEGQYILSNGKRVSVSTIVHVDGKTMIQGKEYYKYVTTSNISMTVPDVPRTYEEARYYRVASDGIYVILGDRTDKPEHLEMPLPIPVGKSWLVQSSNGTGIETHAERVAEIEVNNQKYFDCIKIATSSGGTISELYYAPNVGLVRLTSESRSVDHFTVELLLKRYSF